MSTLAIDGNPTHHIVCFAAVVFAFYVWTRFRSVTSRGPSALTRIPSRSHQYSLRSPYRLELFGRERAAGRHDEPRCFPSRSRAFAMSRRQLERRPFGPIDVTAATSDDDTVGMRAIGRMTL